MIFEYTLGVFVEAADEQEAWEKVRPASEALDAIDYEGQSAVLGPTPISKSVLRQIRMDHMRRSHHASGMTLDPEADGSLDDMPV